MSSDMAMLSPIEGFDHKPFLTNYQSIRANIEHAEELT